MSGSRRQQASKQEDKKKIKKGNESEKDIREKILILKCEQEIQWDIKMKIYANLL